LRKTSIGLQDLRRSLYVKAKAEPTWRFWGLYIHICKLETLREAYQVAKTNDGAPGIDGVSFEDIEGSGREEFLRQIQEELVHRTYRPMRVRKKEIPKDGGKVRVLAIPCIRDRVVQGAIKLILEPVFEADFQPGSYGYRPKRTAHQAVHRVAETIAKAKTRVIDVDLRAYFDNVRHHLLLEKMARRIQDGAVLHLLKMILKATGKQGVPQGGVISPLISNVYLNEVDRMLEAIEVTRYGKERQYTVVQYARFADDLVILIHAHRWNDWVVRAVEKRLRVEFGKLQVEINEEKSRTVDLSNGERFSFLGFEYRRVPGSNGVWRPLCTPKLKKRKALTQKLKEIFRRYISAPTGRMIERINPILRGWVNYFAVGNSSRCFSFVKS
jgi:RNA-directed DNA polymerase